MGRIVLNYAAASAILVAVSGTVAATISPEPKKALDVSFGGGVRGIIKEEGFAMGGRRAVGIVEGETAELADSPTIETGWLMGLFQRQHRTRLHLILDGSDASGFFKVDTSRQYAFDFTLSGYANVAVHIGRYSSEGELLGYMQLITFELSNAKPRLELGKRFILPPDTAMIRPALWLAGTNTITVEAASITRLDVPVPAL